MSKRFYFQLSIGILMGILLLIVGVRLNNQPYLYQGSLIDPPVPAPDFSLPLADGTKFQLSQYRGKIVLLYFGYTFCPDVCPTTLYDLAQVKITLGNQADDIIIAMITVDPNRDSSKKLSSYVRTFDPSFFGLSGEMSELEVVWNEYGVYRQENPVESSAGYLVDHTARVYVIDRLGNLQLTFPYGMSQDAMAEDLSHLLHQ